MILPGNFDKYRNTILKEQDKADLPFHDELKAQIEEKGYDYIGLYQRQYRRWDMFRIIFKVLNMHESMSAPTKEQLEKTDKRGEKTDEGKASKKK